MNKRTLIAVAITVGSVAFALIVLRILSDRGFDPVDTIADMFAPATAPASEVIS